MEKKISSGLIVGYSQQMLVVDQYVYLPNHSRIESALKEKERTIGHVIDSASQCALFCLF